jgi:peptidyl-prolyl cis-trans isomerase D
MATLQNIRNRAGILVAVIIGLALLAFILGDMLNSGRSLLRPSQMEIAKIDGESVQYPDFQKRVDELTEVYKMNTQRSQLDENAYAQLREQTWQTLLHEIIMGKVFDELGITVTGDELFDLIQGNDPHPIVKQLFTNPQTGQVDKSAILQFLKSLEGNATPQQKAYWLYIEGQIKQDRIQSKYNALVSKGLYTTKEEVKKSLAEKNHQVNIQYVGLNYSSVGDSAVTVSEKDLKAYYEAHKDDYKQESTRKIEYITFEVTASAADDAATKKWIEDNRDDFAKAEDNAQYVNANSDTPFDEGYWKKEELSPALGEWAFNSPVGSVYGPYLENNAYKMAKVDQFKMLPDSVEASHILISPQTVGSAQRAKELIDSIKTVIERGGSFAEMAQKYSDDKGSAVKGGDLGWFKRNQMVKEFEEAAFSGEVNKLYIAATRYGYHLIKPTKKGKESNQVRIAILSRNIEPSSQTYQNIYSEASKFAGENADFKSFEKAITDRKLNKKYASMMESDLTVNGMESSRALVRAAFQADKGDILVNNEGSPIFEFGNQFVIAALTGITEAGIAPLEEVKAQVDLAVRKEKKAEVLAQKLKDAASNDLTTLAQKVNSEVKEASNVNFTMFSVPGLGMEPAVVGTATSIAQGKISDPVKGNNGVYVLKAVSTNEGTDTDSEAERMKLSQSLAYRASYQAFEAQKKIVEVVDKRAKFY